MKKIYWSCLALIFTPTLILLGAFQAIKNLLIEIVCQHHEGRAFLALSAIQPIKPKTKGSIVVV
jgi:hypothetical protein